MKLWRYGYPIERLGQRYRLEGSLGSGGMADVCLAWDEREQREVAIKVIKPDVLDQRTLDRFLKEATQIAGWNHPHVLHIYSDLKLELLDASQGAIVPYMVMEYAQGGDLQKRLTAGQPYPLGRTLVVFEQICSGVAYAHQHGVIHRDLKPHNILFRSLSNGGEQAVISDFGLAVEIDASHFSFARAGTLAYMAPEQLHGRAEPASDIFALGVILYQLCTGRLPFRRTLEDLLQPFQLPPAASRINRALPHALDEAMWQALDEEPARRYADALELWEQVRASLAGMNASTLRRSQMRSVPPASNQPASSSRVSRQQSAQASDPAYASVQDILYTTPHQTMRLPDSDHDLHSPRSASLLSTPRPDTPSSPNKQPSAIELSARSREQATSKPGRSSSKDVLDDQALHAKQRRSFARPVLLVSLLVLVALIGSSVAVLVPGSPFARIPLVLGNSVTVTITPLSKDISQTYSIPGSEAGMHTVSSASAEKTTNVEASGSGKIPGTQAKGKLTFFNGAFVPQSVSSGVILKAKSGVRVVTDDVANIPARDAETDVVGTFVVTAHIIDEGVRGNIQALDVDFICCTDSKNIVVRNLYPFTGGKDAQNYKFIQQTDVDKVADPFIQDLTKQAQDDLKNKLQANEQMIGKAQCKKTVATDEPVGDQGREVAKTGATVSVQCTTPIYNTERLKAAVARRFAETAPGSSYKLVKDAVLTQQAFNAGVFTVIAQGTWRYRFTPTEQDRLRRAIAGKKRSDALAYLSNQPGVSKVKLEGINDDAGLLPNETARIIINADSWLDDEYANQVLKGLLKRPYNRYT